jgi:hypothetical protein
MSFLTPPTYSGNTGAVLGKVTYQRPYEFFGQLRSIYNIGTLDSSVNSATESESYSEFVGGYCLGAGQDWTVTPYAGIGLDFLTEKRSGYSSVAPITLKYDSYYALAGLETRYSWPDWMWGLQADCLIPFHQYLRVKTLSGAAWTLTNRIGVSAQMPIAYEYVKNYWLELAPYYRFFPIGSSSALSLPTRNLNQWGAFLTFRFFI